MRRSSFEIEVDDEEEEKVE